jgi:hypothetical protein
MEKQDEYELMFEDEISEVLGDKGHIGGKHTVHSRETHTGQTN